MHLSWGTTGTIRALASVHAVRKGMVACGKRRLVIVSRAGGTAAVVSPAAEGLVDGISLPNVVAFMLIQHLDPKHESHLTELLSKGSKMPISEVESETRTRQIMST